MMNILDLKEQMRAIQNKQILILQHLHKLTSVPDLPDMEATIQPQQEDAPQSVVIPSMI